MRKVLNICFLYTCWLVLTEVVTCNEHFSEELYVKTLDNGFISTFFQFTNQLELNIFTDKFAPHYNLFPKSFGEIISKFRIAELHLTFTQGRWRYNKWGYPILAAPPGVELWVWFHPQLNETQVNSNWFGLVNALSGQFCSSLNFIKKTITVKPKHLFKPLGLWIDEINPEKHLRYAVLSRETVCTENLSPWKKLLPCLENAGLATLLNPFRLYDSSYHSLGVHLKSICHTDACANVKLQLKQTLTSVFNPIHYSLKHGWSLSRIFQKYLRSSCPLAKESSIFVDLTNIERKEISPLPDSWLKNRYAVYDLKTKVFEDEFDISAKYTAKQQVDKPPHITAHKYVTGYGGESGGSVSKIYNNHPTEVLNISYLDTMPYFVRTYLHTLRVAVNGTHIKPVIYLTPTYLRERPAMISLQFSLPPKSSARVSIDFDKVFLDWTQHPPDAHHGYYIGPSVISFMAPFDNFTSQYPLNEQCTSFSSKDSICQSLQNSMFRRIYTEPLLIPVPLPDFSMPYNVICLTCTVVAIAFGSIYNASTRTFQVETEDEDKKTIKERLGGFFKMFLRSEKKVE